MLNFPNAKAFYAFARNLPGMDHALAESHRNYDRGIRRFDNTDAVSNIITARFVAIPR